MSMSERINVADLLEFDASLFLHSTEAVAAFLIDILQANESALLAAALGDIARARGMANIARGTGLTSEVLCQALHPEVQPRFDTMQRVCAALGVRLVAIAV